jgi:hypothetical protein
MMYKLPNLLDASLVARRFIGLNCWTIARHYRPLSDSDVALQHQNHKSLLRLR